MHENTRTCAAARAALLGWVAGTGAVTAEALARRDVQSVARARARLLAAAREGMLTRSRPLSQRPALFVLTRAGARASGIAGAELVRVGASNAQHSIACADVAAALALRYPDHEVIGEHALRRMERERRAVLASAALGRGAAGEQLLHRPDLVLRAPDGSSPVAVEVELTVKAPRRLVTICRAWARCRHVAGVVYVAPEAVRPALMRALERASAGERIVLVSPAALALEELG